MISVLSLDQQTQRPTHAASVEKAAPLAPEPDQPALAAEPAPANPADKPATFDEHTLDKIGLRLMKREPGLAIEKDDIVSGYIYRFLDSVSGEELRQFPAKIIVDTLHALQAVNERTDLGSSTDIAV